MQITLYISLKRQYILKPKKKKRSKYQLTRFFVNLSCFSPHLSVLCKPTTKPLGKKTKELLK